MWSTTFLRRAAFILAVFIPAGVAFAFLTVEVSSQPRFCGTCHYMRPYYESWKTSTHKDAACVECHIPPGIRSEIRKKYEALSMVTRYFTGTYSTNPWAEVDDQSCLRGGCHVKRVLLGQEVFRGVLFDHRPHLTEMRRGKRLRCTSCHSQIVQGKHIAVTSSTCFLCHFKDVRLNEGTSRCTLCHEVPDKTITTAGLSFDHGDVKRFDMACNSCHQGVVKGEGEVMRERCYTCHNDPVRLDRFDEPELLHETHVTEHKVECLHCHMEISHRVPAREEALSTRCEVCHAPAAGHAPVRDLYRGIGAQGVEPRPAAMYLASVRCDACHNVPGTESGRASAVSCMSCHGPKYMPIFRSWQAGTERRLEGVKGELVEHRKWVTDKGGAADIERLRETEHNVAFVEAARGIHNAAYARDILERSHQELVSLLETTGGKKPAGFPWLEAPDDAGCLQCHFGIEYITRPAFGREFPHAAHTTTARLRCTVCHEGIDRHGGMKIGADGCDQCHERIKRPMAGLAAEDCLHCHTAEIGKVAESVNFPHGKHVEMGLGCEVCHADVSQKPHLEFARSNAALPRLGHAFCAACHAADVPADDGGMPEGADCGRCHLDF